MEGELWELVDTEWDNYKKNIVTDDVINCDKNYYSSHALAEFLDGENSNK